MGGDVEAVHAREPRAVPGSGSACARERAVREGLQRDEDDGVVDRFRPSVLPDRLDHIDIARAIITKRFEAAYREQRFAAPHETWPVHDGVFAEATKLTPRELLRRIELHIRWCLDRDEIVELDHLPGVEVRPRKRKDGSTADLDALDQLFAQLVSAADVRGALDHLTEDAHMPALLAAGLAAWIDEQAPSGTTYKQDPPPSMKPALNAEPNQPKAAPRSFAGTASIT